MGKKFLQLFALLFLSVSLNAQTTASIVGFVKDASDKGMVGATVEAVHEPSGTKYKTQSMADGRYTLQGLRIGGPYSIKATYVGYTLQTQGDITLSLGEPTRFDFALAEANNQMQEITVTGTRARNLISKERKGTSTNVNRRVLASLPTLNRSITDFTKLTPQATGTSFAGMDNRFINFAIDGSIFNNSFGLQALPGSQTNSTPISLDAIDEIQVNISPYNLKEAGFTGASINAVTKSGTNTLHGSGFYNNRSESLVGDKAGLDGKQPVVTNAFDVKQFGGSIGGPIIKNKLFFFANYEGERRSDPGTTFTSNKGGEPVTGNKTRVLESDLITLQKYLLDNFDYNTGAYEGYSLITKSDKAILKFDYNISDKHKLVLRGNILKSVRDVPMSSSGSFTNGRRDNQFAMAFANSNYEINNDIYSGILQLNSRLGTTVSNELIVGFTANRDYRAEKAQSFPTVDILSGTDDRNYITFGSEPFTPNNILNTDTYQISDNLTIYKGKHTISTGFNFEAFRFFNQFTPTVNGQYAFHNLDSFYASANAYLANPNMATNPVNLRRYNLSYSNLPGGGLWNAKTAANNFGIYIQDDWAMSDNFTMTYGVRIDVPFFSSDGYVNTEVDNLSFVDEDGKPTKLSTSELPSAKVMISPRWGFNYDIFGNKKTQVRGGIGVFTGRPAFVWISNQVGNNGVQSGSISTDNTRQFPFSPDITSNIPTITNPGQPAPSYNIATTEKNFRFPQVLRANLAVDQNIGWGMIGSVEFLFTQSLSNVYYYNANLRTPTATFSGPDTRPRFPTFNTTTGAVLTGSAFNNAARINSKITDATVLKSGPYGGSFMTTFKIEKPIRSKGLGFMLAYTYSTVKDYISAGSIAFSSWRDNRTTRGNNSYNASFSDNETRSRFIGNINYRTEVFKHAAFQVSLFAQSQNQGRVSYTYSGDMNGDGLSGNDLIYIPKNTSEMNFQQYSATVNGQSVTYTVQAQKDAFERYIQQDPYLSENRGELSVRNGLLLPMVTRFDLSAMLELFTMVGKNRHTIQLRADIFNIGNMIDPSWGVGYIPNNTSPLNARGYDPATGVPVFRMNTVNNSLNYETLRRGASLIDVWQAQFGIRYIF
jgi:Carboxypeptidase regulatory-like domain